MTRDADDWIGEYKKKNALWIHDGNPKRPHALLRSGKHSSGFFNSELVIPDEVLLRDAAADLLELFAIEGGPFREVKLVVGPQTGATKLAEFISDQISAFTRDWCFWSSPAKRMEGEKAVSMQIDRNDLNLFPGQMTLLCEDVLSTGGSVGLAAEAVASADGIVLPFILVLVNRSGLADVNGRKVIALIDRPMPAWDLAECLLCKHLKSEAITAKDPENWRRLNAAY